ncbi:MAG TPA: hypothetical protein VI932_01475, partial [Bacteroidota bacterium]|nr:hypothetical protein [Bacteroidota bacterium]
MKSVISIFLLPGLFLLILAGLFLAGHWSLGDAERDWAGVSLQQKNSVEAEILSAFAQYQDEARRASQGAASAILNMTRDSGGGVPQQAFMEALAAEPLPSLTLEYYDSRGILTAWAGPAGPELGPGILDRMHRSYLDEGPIYSYLVITVPLFRGDAAIGHVVAKRLFTVSHPVNNRFVSSRALALSYQSLAEERTGLRLEFRIPDRRREHRPSLTDGDRASPEVGGEPDPGGAAFIVPLKGVSGAEIGYVVAPSPEKASFLEMTDATYRGWQNMAGIGFIASLVGCAAWRFRRSLSIPAYQLSTLASLWVLRYAMLAVDVPGSRDAGGLFDPSLFASSFGYGAAKSLGDMVISATLLAVTLASVLRMVLARGAAPLSPEREKARPGVAAAVAGVAGMVILLGLLGPLSRGFYAVIQSVVFDSRVDLNDPKVIYPGPPAGALLLGAILLVFSSLLGGIIFIMAA